MKIIETTFERLPRERLVIGFEGENLRATVRIDCASVFAEYPNATPALIVKPLFADAYPVVVDRNGTDVDWLITSEILSFTGDGEIQLTFVKDQVICKSAIAKIRVCRSLQVTGDMPDPVVQWIENANRKLAEVDAQIVELEGMVDTATDAATRAEQSASTASTKAEQAAGSAATATEKATEATQAAGTATAKAAEAQTAAQTATEKANAAAESERIATAKAGDATTAAGTATTKAEQATEAAQTATGKAGEASASATAAQTSATNAASSATAASASETAAKASETAAGASATQAAQSAQNASTAAQTATQKAAEATQSATGAAQSEQTATQKATEAEASAQAAQEAKTAVEETAEQLADSLEQIDQNTQDIAELDERKANIDGYYQDMTVGDAEQLISSKYVENSEPYTFRTSGGSSDIGNREYLDAVVGGTLAWNQMVRDSASENQIDFAPIVTVTDAVEDAAGVKVKIEPVQDLHGYDYPWPAGGGKNKFPVAEWFTAYDVSQNNLIVGDVSVFLKAGAYSLSFEYYVDGATSVNSFWRTYSEEVTSVVASKQIEYGTLGLINNVTSWTQKTVSFTTTQDGWFAIDNAQLRGGVHYRNIQLEAGSATDFAPYSNICPITGWDGVQVWDDPKHGGLIEWNQLISSLNPSVQVYGITRSIVVNEGIRGLRYTGTSELTTNYTACAVEEMYFELGHVYLFDLGCDLPSGCRISVSTLDQERSRILTPTNVGLRSFGVVINSGTIVDFIAYPQVFDLTRIFGAGNEPTTVEEFRAIFPADYSPYNAGEITTVSAVNGDPYRHYSIALPTEAGTVYGGELTVNADGSGSLAVDRASVDMGTLNWGTNSTEAKIYQCNPPNVKPVVEPPYENRQTGAICSMYSASSSFQISTRMDDKSWLRTWNQFFVRDTSYDSASSFKAAMNGVQLVYELATSITYTLTASQITTLLGTNNVWADAGDLALTYTGTDEHLTLESGKKYLARISGTDSMLLGSGQEITAVKGTDNVFDLTKMFGTAVADYVYGQGAAFFRKWFGKQWYPYNAGELLSVDGLQSHDMVGFNQWDWQTNSVLGELIDATNGSFVPSSAFPGQCWRSGYIKVLPNTRYYISGFGNGCFNIACYYDADKNYLSRTGGEATNVRDVTTPRDCSYIAFTLYKVNTSQTFTDNRSGICISLAHNGSRNGEYEPYEKHSYPLDSSVILRGIPKVGANGVYWDGDRYLPDGTVERRYVAKVLTGAVDERWQVYATSTICNRFSLLLSDRIPTADSTAVDTTFIVYGMTTISKNATVSAAAIGKVSGWDMGGTGLIFSLDPSVSLEQFKASLAENPLYLVYELATPTTETAQPYHSTQWVSDWGTEEFVSTGIVPVGHETRYPANLRDKLQHLPDAASGNGSYLITQTDGQMVLTPFPAPPSTAGNYVLKATVTGGVATYTWEVAT